MSTPVWTGRLVTTELAFGVRIFTGPRAKSIEFKQVHQCAASAAGAPAPVKQRLVCSNPNCTQHEKVIDRGEIHRAYQSGRNSPLIPVSDADLAPYLPGPSETVKIHEFFPARQVDPLYFESTYYVHPAAEEEAPYAGLLKALRKTDSIGLGIVVLQKRFRGIVFRAGESGLIAHTLYGQAEARHLQEFRTEVSLASPEFTRPAVREIKNRLNQRVPQPFDPAADLPADPYRAGLTAMLEQLSKDAGGPSGELAKRPAMRERRRKPREGPATGAQRPRGPR